jgi:hypothetical protein
MLSSMVEDSQFKTYLFTYRHDGAEWLLPLKAASPEDAKRRLRNIAVARFDGEVFAKIEMPRFPWISRLRNLVKLKISRPAA